MTTSFKTRLANRETLYGTIVTLPSPTTAEILAEVGFDWFFLDGEHGPLQLADLLGILQAVGDKVPYVVRVPEAAEVPIKQVLDLGATGGTVPQVNSAEVASRVVRYAKYAPQGARGVGLARAHGYGFAFQDTIDNANERTVVIVQAEHADAVNNIVLEGGLKVTD